MPDTQPRLRWMLTIAVVDLAIIASCLLLAWQVWDQTRWLGWMLVAVMAVGCWSLARPLIRGFGRP